jgi:hypothetical protein
MIPLRVSLDHCLSLERALESLTRYKWHKVCAGVLTQCYHRSLHTSMPPLSSRHALPCATRYHTRRWISLRHVS